MAATKINPPAQGMIALTIRGNRLPPPAMKFGGMFLDKSTSIRQNFAMRTNFP